MTNKTIMTTSPPTYVKVEKSSIQELATPESRLLCVVLIHFSCEIQLKAIFPHGLTPVSGQDEQSYSVFLFESMCGLGFIYSMQFKLFTENRIIHILVGYNITLITEIFASKT